MKRLLYTYPLPSVSPNIISFWASPLLFLPRLYLSISYPPFNYYINKDRLKLTTIIRAYHIEVNSLGNASIHHSVCRFEFKD